MCCRLTGTVAKNHAAHKQSEKLDKKRNVFSMQLRHNCRPSRLSQYSSPVILPIYENFSHHNLFVVPYSVKSVVLMCLFVLGE